MDFARLEQRIMRDEGWSGVAYLDTVGVWTVGYGSTRILGVPVKEHDSITLKQGRTLLRDDIYQSLIDCQKLFDFFDELDPVRQEILVNMCYYLGVTGLSKFRNMRSALHARQFQRAAEEMVDSKWYTQVGGRGQRLVAAMKTGTWLDDPA
jgi:lysozyme